MRRLSSTWPLLLATLTLPPSALSCKKEQKSDETATAPSATASMSEPTTSAAVQLSFKPTEAQTKRAEEMGEAVSQDSWTLDPEFEFKPDDQQVALLLAATGQNNAKVCTGLRYLSRDAKPGSEPTADQVAVLEHFLKADDSRVASCAVTGAKPFVTGNSPHKVLLNGVLSAGRTPAFQARRERIALLDTLSAVGIRKRGAGQQLIEESARSNDSDVQISALEMLFNERQPPRYDEKLEKIGLGAVSSKEPIARGLAAELLSKAGKGSSAATGALSGLLDDDHPYVRAKAALALAALSHRPALHKLASMTTDDAKTGVRYSITVHGEKIPRALHASAWGTVADAVLTAADRLTGPELKLSPVLPADQAGSLKKRGQEFLAWYKTNKAQITTPAQTAEAQAAPSSSGQAAKPSSVPAVDKPASANVSP